MNTIVMFEAIAKSVEQSPQSIAGVVLKYRLYRLGTNLNYFFMNCRALKNFEFKWIECE